MLLSSVLSEGRVESSPARPGTRRNVRRMPPRAGGRGLVGDPFVVERSTTNSIVPAAVPGSVGRIRTGPSRPAGLFEGGCPACPSWPRADLPSRSVDELVGERARSHQPRGARRDRCPSAPSPQHVEHGEHVTRFCVVSPIRHGRHAVHRHTERLQDRLGHRGQAGISRSLRPTRRNRSPSPASRPMLSSLVSSISATIVSERRRVDGRDDRDQVEATPLPHPLSTRIPRSFSSRTNSRAAPSLRVVLRDRSGQRPGRRSRAARRKARPRRTRRRRPSRRRRTRRRSGCRRRSRCRGSG